MKRICFTGHRPDSLFGYDLEDNRYKLLERAIKRTLFTIMKDKEEKYHFIFGGAIGVDQMTFDIVSFVGLVLQRDMVLEVATPFINQYVKWNEDNIKTYKKQLQLADVITHVDRLDEYKIKGCIEDIYYPAKMQKRNMYMVDNSDIVIAVWNGDKGGTGNCVQYAKKLGKKIIYINPRDIKF